MYLIHVFILVAKSAVKIIGFGKYTMQCTVLCMVKVLGQGDQIKTMYTMCWKQIGIVVTCYSIA